MTIMKYLDGSSFKGVCVIVSFCLALGAYAQPEIKAQGNGKDGNGKRAPRADGNLPKLQVAKPEGDCVVLQGEKSDLVFRIRNVGNADLEIADLKTACGCTPAKLEQPIVVPGGMTTLTTTVNTWRKQGRVKASIYFHSNDLSQPEVALESSVFVRATFLHRPLMIGFGSHPYDRAIRTSITLETVGKKAVDIIDVAPLPGQRKRFGTKILSSRILSASYEGSISDSPKLEIPGMIRKQYQVEVTANPTSDLGKYEGLLVVRTSVKDEGPYYLLFQGTVLGDIEPDPPFLDFGTLKPGESKSISLSLHSKNNRPFQIKQLDAQDLPLSWKAYGKEGSKHVLTLTLTLPKATRDDTDIFDIVRIIFDDPKEPPLRLNIMCKPKI